MKRTVAQLAFRETANKISLPTAIEPIQLQQKKHAAVA
jgi:hypothetical protein